MEKENAKALWHMRPPSEQRHQMFQMQPMEQADYPGRSDLLVAYSAVPALLERFIRAGKSIPTNFPSAVRPSVI